ncbi:MAG TPA: 50S ribosomal protein L10 [Syntrophorhabdaceae bacterium]|nr:50S ribosomal protein L10 [Syntrophorhabdaceae bacterium]HNS14685.1 50S ribosomal protein L10 [Syntrophorhabdaceae bacterium]HNT68852.1 50S ribosomal protein L10 [Syntrophorhabdaceae bacterium]
MERSKKEKVVEELGTRLKALNYMFLTDYSGMSVAQITKLRRELRSVDTEFSVVKNSLMKIAAQGTKAELLKDKYDGPNAIVCIYKDPINAARVIAGLIKEIPNLKLKAGFLGDRVITPEEILRLATLPSRDVLIGKLLGLLKGQPQRLVYVLSGNLNKLMLVLNAIKMQKEQA